jgi:recombination associated protein RdgC
MSLLSNTVSICQFQVVGDLPPDDIFSWASTCLTGQAFRPIDEGSEEISVGWVHIDDPQESSFTAPQDFWRDHYLTFTMRRDQRQVPSALLKPHMEKAEADFLAAHPGLQRVPRQHREEMRDAVREALLAQTLPIPALFDVVWDTRNGRLTLTSLNAKVVDLFETLFRETFDGLKLTAVHPFARAEAVIDQNLLPALQQANQASSDAVLEMIEDNRWIGQDFLLWLMYRTMESPSTYAVNQPGSAQLGEGFTAYLNDRLLLVGGGENGVQKVTVIGPQDAFSEVRTALQEDKQISEAILHMEKLEDQWKLTLKGDTFHLASFKAPTVKIEKDNRTEDKSEKEAVFYERMYVLEAGLQLFDSLFRSFLELRLAPDWSQTQARIESWLNAPA